jgi:hypothetical protein
MKVEDGVWVFNGPRGHLPAAVFKELEIAERWIEENKLSGLLTLYPLDTSLYDFALAKGWFEPKHSYQSEAQFKATFTCALLPHHHYEDGKREA